MPDIGERLVDWFDTDGREKGVWCQIALKRGISLRLIITNGVLPMRVMHCGLWQRATTVYSLFPPPGWGDLKRVVVMVLECPQCDQTAYSWYGVTLNNKSAPVMTIHPKEFDAEWRARIAQNQIPDGDVQRQRLMVSQYSRSIARPADCVGRYLRRVND